MSNSKDRFYQMSLSDRDALFGDIGSEITIEGIVVGTNKSQMVLMLPTIEFKRDSSESKTLTAEEWSDFIQRSDNPEILVGNAKIFQRKLRYTISGDIQQKVFAADGFVCKYCGVRMGEAALSVDHLVPLELGGENNVSNYISACRKCNKRKGNTHPKVWCESMKVNYDDLLAYISYRNSVYNLK